MDVDVSRPYASDVAVFPWRMTSAIAPVALEQLRYSVEQANSTTWILSPRDAPAHFGARQANAPTLAKRSESIASPQFDSLYVCLGAVLEKPDLLP